MRSVVVTGANRGIGRELVRQLHRLGDAIHALGRTVPDQPFEPSVDAHLGVDTLDQGKVDAVAAHLADRSIDLLINNAAIYIPDDWRTTDWNRAREQFDVNVLGTLRVTRALVPKLRRGAKVVMVSSQSGSIARTRDDEDIGYRMSKAALNMATKVLANGLAKHDISIVAIHPGSVATRMNPAGGLSTMESARGILALIDRMDGAMTGTFWDVGGQPMEW
jgi:NAD(P)-dependent dehydrogenase (short-subunit alcohol dehydrogenase family)